MSFELPDEFVDTITEKYEQAHEAGEIIFTESTNEYLESDDIEYVITLASSLSKKPTQEQAPEQIKRPKDFNPFLNPDPSLLVLGDYGGQFNILLNKFPITPNHLLLTTKEFKPQTSPLLPQELVASMKILAQLEKSSKNGEKFFGFYNCGENSGASQPHKHLQFLKLPPNFSPFPNSLVSGEEPFLATSVKEPLQNKNLPFAHFALPLPKDEAKLFDEDYLALAFSSLLQRALTIFRDFGKPTAYNVIFTRKWLLLVPRSDAYYVDENNKNLKLGINAAGFIGLLLAKNEELRSLIKTVGPTKILEQISFPNTSGQPTNEYHY